MSDKHYTGHDDSDYEEDDRPRYDRGRDSGRERDSRDRTRDRDREEEALSKHDVNRFAEDAFKKSANAMGSAELGKTKKIFGVFEVDAGIAAWFSSTYNVASDYLSTKIAPKAYDITKQYGHKVGLAGEQLKGAAAIASIGSTVALKAGGYVSPIIDAWSTQRKERAHLARQLAPVLDDLKGNHSVGALFSVTQEDNEVIFAHRKRLSKIAQTTNVNNMVDLGINSGANLALDAKRMGAIWSEKANISLEEMQRRQERKVHEQQLKADTGSVGDNGQGKHLFGVLINTSVGQVADRLQKSGEHKLRNSLQPYSALEMILELEEQVGSKPDASSFQVPRGFHSPNGRQDQYPLEEYVMRIFIQHQKEMADLSTDHTEIREALRQDLSAVAKPIAAAIRSGDMSVMSLMRLVGEGKIIKKHGRAIASSEDVRALIKREEPKQASYASVDPAEYYKDAAFTRDQLKSALKTLDGEEKMVFSSMFPDGVLLEAGMGKKDIKAMRHATLKSYDRMIGEAISGLNAKSDADLKTAGLGENEIESIREGYKKIEHSGTKAIHDLKSSPVNEHGIEHLLTNVVVHQPKYLGKLLTSGREAYEQIAANDKEYRPATHKASNDENYGHASREVSRRTGTHDYEAGID